MKNNLKNKLYDELSKVLNDNSILSELELKTSQMRRLLGAWDLRKASGELVARRDARGRFVSTDIIDTVEPFLDMFCTCPEEGWLQYTYNYVLGQIFPAKADSAKDHRQFAKGRFLLLKILNTLYRFERQTVDFDPTVDMPFLRQAVYEKMGVNREYMRFDNFAHSYHLYEFMRIGSEISPYNTLGHIAGVHYVAMHVARQLWEQRVPVDLGLVSGAAAGHDLGKYGCKKSEERRIPYLHYYYTDVTFLRLGMPMIGHIASNHSTWDLELENLPVEALILIYADFRVKSSRDAEGREQVHFYSLKESFDVILSKLDNVDAAKELRYRRVYDKLKNFEDYMRDRGVNVNLPQKPKEQPDIPPRPAKKHFAFLRADQITAELKNMSISHNVLLMDKFFHDEKLGNLLESARSEREWKNLRTYVSIFGEYSTYMTEKQKLMTLRFLKELLTHKESDIRVQAGRIVGQIIGRFNDEYKKELPEDVSLPVKTVTNVGLFKELLEEIMTPDYRLTEQHKKWFSKCLKSVFGSVLRTCAPSQRDTYVDAVMEKVILPELTPINKEALTQAVLILDAGRCTKWQLECLSAFADTLLASEQISAKLAGLSVKEAFAPEYFDETVSAEKAESAIGESSTGESVTGEGTKNGADGTPTKSAARIEDGEGAGAAQNAAGAEDTEAPEDDPVYRRIKETMGYETTKKLSRERLSEMYLDNLKARTPWAVKVCNIRLMLRHISDSEADDGQALHIATHLCNLVKVSETVTVRRFAGKALLDIIGKMPIEQRNEIVVELYNGLEIGDYQFSKYIPEYLGKVVTYLQPDELDEVIADMEKHLDGSNAQVASAVLHTYGVMLENYEQYERMAGSTEMVGVLNSRKHKMVGMILRGFANYNNMVSQEALWALGTHAFGSEKLSMEDKAEIFARWAKKLLMQFENRSADELDFFNQAAVLNHIYRFICQYEVDKGRLRVREAERVAFFPGTFDPFSLGHKAIAREIRDQGFDVYLSLDEFSWSKKTQPRLHRRRIISMSISDEEGIFLFPDDIPVNIANPKDIRDLKGTFEGRELYFVSGSDVIENASCYRAEPQEDSIHSLKHIVFKRASDEIRDVAGGTSQPVLNDVTYLELEEHFEDISSTRIRENIDMDRDISNLIDSVVQKYIYDRGLYLREPAYKHVLLAQDVILEELKLRDSGVIADLESELRRRRYDMETVKDYLDDDRVKTVGIRDGKRRGKMVAVAAMHRLESDEFINAFGNQELSSFIRSKAKGAIAVIGGLFVSRKTSIDGLAELLLTETVSELMKRDYTYVVYLPSFAMGERDKSVETLENFGFCDIAMGERSEDRKIYGVDMSSPVIVLKNIDTIIKSPLNKNEKVIKAVERAHQRMMRVLRQTYEGELIMSISSGMMHHKMINIITRLNGVPAVPRAERVYGANMAVPFGKILENIVVPNTVTKALHTEKYFSLDVEGFTVEECMHYSSLQNQVRTIKSFNRPVILVDDMMHKGYRMNKLHPILKEHSVNVVATVTGVLTGRGKDLMTLKGRQIESAYFLPNLKCWIDETASYPYLGGDGIKPLDTPVAAFDRIPSINLVLPYAVPAFLGKVPQERFFEYSMVCLENARDILKTLETEYQNLFERKLTLRRLGEVITKPGRPDLGDSVLYDEAMAASTFVENDISNLVRLKKLYR